MPTLDPRSPEFWNLENALLWEAVSPLTMRALLAGAETAASMLPPSIQPLISWDFFNQAAISYLQEYRLSTVANITDTTRRQIVSMMDDWIREGSSLTTLQERLSTIPTLSATRADSIAITEVTRTYAEGNLRLWQSTGLVSVKKWQTAVDERVCPICRPLHDMIVEIDGAFSHRPEDVAANRQLQMALRHLGSSFNAPPAHPRCRCWLLPGISEVTLEQELDRILAQEFFAKVKAEGVGVFVT